MQNILAAIATLGPVGLLPAPGTAGSFAAVVMAAALTNQAGMIGLVIGLVVVTVIAFPAISAYTKKTGVHDAGPVVIDEVIGQWLPLLLLPPFTLTVDACLAYGAAFVLFRVFDILKPGLIRRAEAMPGAAGVIADDVLAGITAGVILWGGMMIWGQMA